MRQLQLTCPNPQCQLTLMIPGEAFGQRVRCAACGRSFVVPIARIVTPSTAKRKRKAS